MSIHLVAGLAWLGLAGAGLWLGGLRRSSLAFAAAALLQAGWAGWPLFGPAGPLPGVVFEIGRSVAWSLFFVSLLPGVSVALRRAVVAGGLVLIGVRLGLPMLETLPALTRVQLALMTELVAVIAALCLNVAVFRAAGETSRWSLKLLCFPLAGMFAYDLYIYGQALSIGLPSQGYIAARGIIALLGAPFVLLALLRGRLWPQGLQVSRQAALYSVALVAVGLYLLAVAGATLLIRHWDIALTPAMRVGLLFGTALLLVILLTSGRFRAGLKLFISRHFFASKYDYAHEWRKFMQTVAFEGPASPLENRIIRACADVLEVPGGALWVLEGGRPQLQATWHYRPNAAVQARAGDVEALFADSQGRYTVRTGDELRTAGLAAADREAWLGVPLPHGGELLGFLLLAPPRVRHRIDTEDRDLLMLIAHQCAGYLAEKQAAAALQTEKQFSRFNRQYAFVAHDIKNLVSQLAVMLKNFDRHADNPEFQRDLQETVQHAVTRMRGLLDRLNRLHNREPDADGDGQAVAAAEVVRAEIARADGAAEPPRLSVADAAADGHLRVSPERFAGVLRHLLANAREAAGPAGRIAVDMDAANGWLVLNVTDDGPGMSLDFVRETLFTPFRSTKSGGFGVGVYQCREFAREHGGDLEAISSPGSGTTMRLWLPLVDAPEPAAPISLEDDGADHVETARSLAAGG